MIEFSLAPPENATTKPRICGYPAHTIEGLMKAWRVYYPCGIGYRFSDSFDTLPEAYAAALKWYDRERDN